MRTVLLAAPCLALCASPAPAQERALATDRPDKTESPYTVEPGRFQIEMDLATFTSDRSGDDGAGDRVETLNIAPFNIKAGLTESLDLQLIFEPYIRQTITSESGGSEIDGIGDVTIRLKQNLWGNDGGATAFALMPFVKLPTNTGNLGNDAVEFGLIAPLAVALSDRVGLGLMTEIDILEEADGDGYAPTLINSATISFDITDALGLYTEIFTERSLENGVEWVATFDTGITYALSDNLQVDGGVNLGLTDAADDVNVFIGVAQRF